MAQYKIPDPEDLIECPYDKVHMVRAKRFPYHLMKCRRNYCGNDYATCPFNARHEMPRPELRYHMSNCPDKAVVEQEILFRMQKEENDGTYFKGNTDVPAYKHNWQIPDSGEDWDAEAAWTPRIGVDRRVLDEKATFRDLTGKAPAEKKKFHDKLLRNFHRKAQGLPPVDSDEEREEEERQQQQQQQQQQQLRLPKHAPQVLQAVPQATNTTQQVPSVFAYNYSLVMPGIGRGRGVNQPAQQNGVAGQGTMRQPRIAANIFGGVLGAQNGQANDNSETLYQRPQQNGEQKNQSEETLYQRAPVQPVPPFQPTTVEQNDSNAAVLQALMRGRGIGRGISLESATKACPGVGRGMTIAGRPPPQMTQQKAPSPPRTIVHQRNGIQDCSPVFSMDQSPGGQWKSVGRGRGKRKGDAQPEFVVPNVNQQQFEDCASDQKSPSSSPPPQQTTVENRKKEIKKLQKKLRGIQVLEQRLKDGVQLNDDQLEKVAKKQEVEDLLAELSLD